MDVNKLINHHQLALDQACEVKTKIWWEKYLKGTIKFRGVGIPKNRELLAVWRTKNEVDKLSYEEQLQLALAFFQSTFAEDKLAGILYIQEYLIDKLSWELLLSKSEHLYDDQLIYDWNICDWFCIRILGPLILFHGEPCANYIINWKDASYLWKARSALVSFVNLASNPTYYPRIRNICNTLIQRQERFAKTAVGWILRDISKSDQQFVLEFVDEYLSFFTRETINNALKYQDKETKQLFLNRLILT